MASRGGFDTLAPTFAVEVNGQTLPNEAFVDLIGLSVLEDVDAASMFTLTLAAWDTVRMEPKWIDDKLFRIGNPVQIGFGYANKKTTPLMAGEIVGIEPDFPEGRPVTLTVRGFDRRHSLMRARRTRSFTNSKDSDIVSRIAREAGLDPKVQDTRVTLPYVLQHNQTDYEFLVGRAVRIDHEVVVEGKALIFRPRETQGEEVATLRREIELLEFRPRLSTLGQAPEIEVRGWDPKGKQEIVGRAGVGDEVAMSGTSGPAEVRDAFQTVATARVTEPVHSQQEADQLAKRGFVEMALRYVVAEGLCIGDPKLRAGKFVRVEGVGQRFSGSYYVTAVEHRFGRRGGYRTSFSARRNAA